MACDSGVRVNPHWEGVMPLAVSAAWWLGGILLFILYFIFSLICFPLALLVAYLVRDRRGAALA